MNTIQGDFEQFILTGTTLHGFIVISYKKFRNLITLFIRETPEFFHAAFYKYSIDKMVYFPFLFEQIADIVVDKFTETGLRFLGINTLMRISWKYLILSVISFQGNYLESSLKNMMLVR